MKLLKRFSVIVAVLMLPLLATAATTDAPAHELGSDRWQELKAAFFGDRAIVDGSALVSLDAPKRAHDAAVVPVTVHAVDGGLDIKQLHLIVDKNPVPLAGIFKFDGVRSDWQSLETRIRINEYTNVRAIAELDDGSLHMATRFVKASGGCSAPAMADMEKAMARAGKMRILLDKISDNTAEVSSEATIKISHPNNSGMQFDQVSRNYIPAFFVHSIGAELNGEKLLTVETNFSMSENPVVRFQFEPSPDAKELTVFAIDSKNNRFEQAIDIGTNTTN